MSEANSPYFRAGMIHGAYDAARPGNKRRGFHPDYAHSWMYRRGFARAFLAVRKAARDPGCLDDRPETIEALQRGLDDAWAALERAAEGLAS
jgi:hypothetical protein